MMNMFARVSSRITVAAILGLTMLISGTAMAGESGAYTFTVLRDGEPIGSHWAAFWKDGDRIEIAATSKLKVTFALIPLFEFEHERREIWEKGRPRLIRANTVIDGEEFDITVRRHGRGLIREVNGRVEKLDDAITILALWNKETVTNGRHSFVSVVEDKKLDLTFTFVGKETLTVDGKQIETEHYRMTGDEERDIWYDSQGAVVKVEFERRGSRIEYVRNEAELLPAPDRGRIKLAWQKSAR